MDLKSLRYGQVLRVGYAGGETTGIYAGVVNFLAADGAITQYAKMNVGDETWLVPANQLASYPAPEPTAQVVSANEPPAHEVNLGVGDTGGTISEHP